MRPDYVVLYLLLLVGIALLAQTRAPKLVHQDEFYVVGIEVRTSGERELSGEAEIPGLWRRFYSEHMVDKIPNRVDKNIYALYTDYVRDRMADYAVLLGVRVKDKSEVPAGMVLKTIPAGQYAIITSEKGPGETVIPTAWQKVWALEDKDQLGGKRAYKTDYELYDERATDPQNLQADLYIGLKPAPADHPDK